MTAKKKAKNKTDGTYTWTAKKRNPNDLTGRNNDARKKEILALKKNIESLRSAQHEWIVHLLTRIRNLEQGALSWVAKPKARK